MLNFFIIASLIAVICLLFVFSSDKTTNGIDSIKDYEAVFQPIDELKFYIGDNNFYSTQSPNKELKQLNSLESTPIPFQKTEARIEILNTKL